jgi:hypothetical protein
MGTRVRDDEDWLQRGNCSVRVIEEKSKARVQIS